jgi:hypothetical protein
MLVKMTTKFTRQRQHENLVGHNITFLKRISYFHIHV